MLKFNKFYIIRILDADLLFTDCIIVLHHIFSPRAWSIIPMGGLLLHVEMVNTSYTQHWHGEIGPLVQHWRLFGRLMENMLLGKVRQESNYLAKISRSATLSNFIRILLFDTNLCIGYSLIPSFDPIYILFQFQEREWINRTHKVAVKSCFVACLIKLYHGQLKDLTSWHYPNV